MTDKHKIYREYYLGGLLIISIGVLYYFLNPINDASVLNRTEALFTLLSIILGRLGFMILMIAFGLFIIVLGKIKLNRLEKRK